MAHTALAYALGTVALGVLPLSSTFAERAVLTYQGSNIWVAEADNAPLRKAFKAARKGTDTFTVVLPASGPSALTLERLNILSTLLEKQRGQPVTLSEATGRTAPNSITLSW